MIQPNPNLFGNPFEWQDLQILELVAQQVEKDFLSATLDHYLEIERPVQGKGLYHAVWLAISNVSTLASGSLQQLLYRIDLSEEKGRETNLEILAEEILKRCLQKVILKKYYS